jgi:hypothetical protein
MVILSSTSRSHPALMPPLSKGLYYYSGLVQGKHRPLAGQVRSGLLLGRAGPH